MNVIIMEDELTAKDVYSNKAYEIHGLEIKKPDLKPNVFYELDSPMCKAIRARGTTSDAVLLNSGKINLL